MADPDRPSPRSARRAQPPRLSALPPVPSLGVWLHMRLLSVPRGRSHSPRCRGIRRDGDRALLPGELRRGRFPRVSYLLLRLPLLQPGPFGPGDRRSTERRPLAQSLRPSLGGSLQIHERPTDAAWQRPRRPLHAPGLQPRPSAQGPHETSAEKGGSRAVALASEGPRAPRSPAQARCRGSGPGVDRRSAGADALSAPGGRGPRALQDHTLRRQASLHLLRRSSGRQERHRGAVLFVAEGEDAQEAFLGRRNARRDAQEAFLGCRQARNDNREAFHGCRSPHRSSPVSSADVAGGEIGYAEASEACRGGNLFASLAAVVATPHLGSAARGLPVTAQVGWGSRRLSRCTWRTISSKRRSSSRPIGSRPSSRATSARARSPTARARSRWS